jgi:hypothetical protein
MVKDIINNLPNIKSKTQFEQFVLPNREGFENNISSINNSTIQSSEISETKYDKLDAEFVEDKNENGDKQISVLSTLTSNEKTIPNKLPNIQGIEPDVKSIDKVDVKKYKLDWVSSIYIGSISVVGLYVAYKAIKRTI